MFGDAVLGIADIFIKEVKMLYIIWGQDCDNNVYNV